MSNLEAETGMFSLADLAQLNTDEIVAIQTRLPNAGVYTIQGEELRMVELPKQEGKEDQPPLVQVKLKYRPLDLIPVDKTLDVAAFIASERMLNETYTLWPSDLMDCIGLLKGRFELVGLDNSGHMGGVEGQEPGWLDGFVGAQFQIRVDIRETKGGPRAFFTWLKPELAAA